MSETLPAPDVVEAQDGRLDPDTAEAVVVVAPYEGMSVGDTITLAWGAGSGAGGYADSLPVNRFVVGKPVEFLVDGAFIAPHAGGSLTVAYTVTRADGTQETSAEHTLRTETGTA